MKLTMTDRVLAFLKKNPSKKFTYSDIAKRLKSKPIAIGQCMKAIYNRGDKSDKDITKRVVGVRA